MDVKQSICELKRQLKADVGRFYRNDRRRWKAPIVETLRELKQSSTQAVFFGGTLRSLLIARLFRKTLGRPRDVDIVVSGQSIDSLREQFQSILSRQTRFGGLQLRRREWQFDVWPLQHTWAFIEDAVSLPRFAELPSTTFFNLEAIAVEVWPKPGQSREIFSGEDQFFEGIRERLLEVNREENPFPQLCVVRALVMASSLNFSIGSRLARYIVAYGKELDDGDFDEIQRKHYGRIRQFGSTLRHWVRDVEEALQTGLGPVTLPEVRQQALWPEYSEPGICVRIHARG